MLNTRDDHHIIYNVEANTLNSFLIFRFIYIFIVLSFIVQAV